MNPSDLLSPETALRGLAVLTAGCTVTLVMRRASAAARHHVLLCTLTAALLIPLAAAMIPKLPVIPTWQSFPPAAPATYFLLEEPTGDAGPAAAKVPTISSARPKSAPVITRITTAPEPKRAIPRRKIAATLWLAGMSIILAASLRGMFNLRRLKRYATPLTSGPVFEEVISLAGNLDLHRKIQILISDQETMPMVWGIFRHCLLLPSSATGWTQDRLRIVLLHELSHLRRGDPASLLLARLALACHWFNPMAWVAHRQLRAEQETACDDLVLSHGITAPDYADEMLAFSAGITLQPSHLPASMMLRGDGLERRLRGILSTTLNRRPLSSRAASKMTLLAALLAAPFAILGAADLVMKAAARGRILDRNGIVLAETKGEGASRVHPFKALGVHLIGLSNPKSGGKGTAGVEQSFEEELGAGRDVTLTLDARIQSVVESTLRESGIGRGAVVILDPANGDVLASASVPSFNPENFSEMEEFRKLGKAETQPFQNRAINAFAPGSTFIIVPALAAARSGHMDKRYTCSPVKFGEHQVSCWLYNKSRDSHGHQNFSEAFTAGCGSYFNRLSMDIGFRELSATARLLGLGRPTGIRLPDEPAGNYGARDLPDGAHVTDVEACFIGMGQGNANASPLQIASMTATVANGGRVFTPRLDLSMPASMTADLTQHGIDAGRIKALQDGMTGLIATYPRCRSERVKIAGKTGTAQTMLRGKKSHNAWFTGYAPAEAPRYAIAVMIQDAGSGGGVAGPIARRILETITGELPAPAVQPPNEGHLRRLETEDINL